MKRYFSYLVFALLIINALAIIGFNVEPSKGWSGTVYIRADGSIDPPDAPIVTHDNITYTLIGNISSSADVIIVERDNIIIDGRGYTLHGPGPGPGPAPYKFSGVVLSGRRNVTLKNAIVTNVYYGIKLDSSSNSTISGNIITNVFCGIKLDSSSNSTISGNIIKTDRGTGIHVSGRSEYGNRISGNDISDCWYGIRLSVPMYSGAFIFRNRITKNVWAGIYLDSSLNNTIYENDITWNKYYGIYFGWSSEWNIIYKNNITRSQCGVYFYFSPNNKLFHNNFVCNGIHAKVFQIEGVTRHSNIWDDGYPSGGNYWSDYTGIDEKTGPYQNETGSDGISDTPYVIDVNNRDRYPLIYPRINDSTKPTANAGPDQTVNAGSILTFNASGSIDNVGIVRYEWDFGDGTIGIGKITNHTYSNPGIYTVTLTVKDAAGNTATDSIIVTVLPTTVTVPPTEVFPLWVLAAIAVMVGVATITAFTWKRRKIVHHS